MSTSRRALAHLFFSIFLLPFSTTSSADELTSTYIWRIPRDSLQAAEEDLWNDTWFGSAYYTFKRLDPHRRYTLSPTPDYIEADKLTFASVPGAPCGDGPLEDQFGNDWCSGIHPGACCASMDDWRAAVRSQFSSQDCPLQFEPEDPWIEGVTNDITYPRVYPEEYIITFTRYSKHVRAKFGEGTTSLCGRELSWGVTATAPGHCPGGYDLYQGGFCDNWHLAFIIVSGAEVAEQSNSCSVENPCHPTTGDKTLSEPDFSSPTLPLSRHYHSRQNFSEIAGMGKGWSHTYSGRVMVDGSTIRVIDHRGSVEHYKCADSPTCSIYSSESESGNMLRPLTGGWEVTLKSGEQRQYGAQGKLVSIAERAGKFRDITIFYNAMGNVEQVIDQSGRSLQFSYNDNSLVESITLPDGNLIQYEYLTPPTDPTHNARFNLVKVIYQDLAERNYHYENTDGLGSPRFGHLLTGITDEKGAAFAAYTYDDAARVTSSQHAEGAGLVTLNYTRRSGESFDWSITEVTMPMGEVVTYDMEPGPFRKVTDIEDARGNITMTYDHSSTWRTSKTDREGNRTTYTYNNLHETSRTEAAGTADARVIETDWNSLVNRVSEIREPGSTATFTYNTRGQVLTRTIKDTATLATRTWAYNYFEPPSLGPLIGQIESIDGPRTDVADITSYEYYTNDHVNGDYLIGDLKAVVNALDHRTRYLKYDFNGRPLQIQDANNVMTVLTYHQRGWISSQTTDGKTTRFTYDNVGNLTRVTLPDNSYTRYEYDDAHRLKAIADSDENRVEYTLDAAGNRTAEKTYDGIGVLHRQLSRVFNTLNQLDTLIDGNSDPTHFGYDNNGNRADSVDANLNITSFEYDGLDRLSKSIDAILGETTMEYDGRDNLLTVTDPMENVTRFTYDGLDNQIELDSPDTGTTRYEFDAAGNRIASTDAKQVRVEYFYDALNRLTDITYPDHSLNVSFTYDTGQNGKGRLTGMTDSLGTVNYTYDARGNLLSETRGIGVDQYMTRYTYNPADRLIRITYPSGMEIDYTLDTTGRITAVDQTVNALTESLAFDVEYKPFGPVSTFIYGNGLTYSATFDQDYELEQLQTGAELDWLLDYDPAGNVLTIDDQNSPDRDQVFNYDALNRLDTAQGLYGNEDFDYDANGNRTHFRNGAVENAYTYESQSNRLASQNGWTFTRDAAGNRTAKLNANGHGQLYLFADNNRLTQTLIRDASGESAVGDYVYDGRGQRTIKTSDERTIHYLYGTSGELIGEYELGTGNSTEYVYLNGQILALHRSGSTPLLVSTNVDNTDTGVSFTGDWKSSTSVAGYLAADYQFLAPNSVAEGGVVIDNTDNEFSVTGTWPASTVIPGYHGTNYKYHAPNGIPSGGTVIDNGDNATRQVGTWPISVHSPGYQGSHYSYHGAGIGENTYTWSLAEIPAGDYQLYATWTSHSNRATNARYDIHHADGNQAITVNQKANGGKWNLLGTFTVDAASEVVLSDDANGYVIADAVQLVPIGSAPNSATWEPGLSEGSYRVYAIWAEASNRATNATYSTNHAVGITEIAVDQSRNGGSWQLLGTFNLDEMSNVALTDKANGYVIADALYFVPENQPDNSFTWPTNTASPGLYEVFARWTAHANRPTNAVYRVTHVTGNIDVTVDQTQNGGEWVSLGSFMLDAASTVSLLKNSDGHVIADAIRVEGIVNQAQNGLFFIHSDHLGTPRQVTDYTQTVVWRWDSTPFGNSPANEDPDGDLDNFTLNLRFPGQYYDAESGLHYNYYRTYDPEMGRYIESDPIGLRGSLNTYAYVDSEPLNSIDPTGLVKIFGSWCGPDWSGGFRKAYNELGTAERRSALPPVDELDQCCQTHDITYADCRARYPCNSQDRQGCFQEADRRLNRCASRTHGSSRQFLLMIFDPLNGGNPNRAIADYMRDSKPSSEPNAEECSCEN